MAGRVIAIKELLLIVFYLCGISSALAEKADDQRIVQLDNEYQQLLEEIYLAQSGHSKAVSDLQILWSEYQHLSKRQRAGGNGLIVANKQLFSTQADNPLVVSVVDMLLKNNERHLAETIYGLVEEANETGNLSYLDYSFAKYHALHHNWLQVNQLLQEISIDLDGDDADYAYLLQGRSLQFLKKHRQSIESYDAIADNSPYFVHARLNTALANIRQGWTTEAQSIITKLIPVSQNQRKTELTNRLFVVLGYALLQQEYYRDARNAFRNVASDSSYTNRALFGIALSAISQGDHEAGLNAVNMLKQSESYDLSRDEAYLLSPYIFERLDQSLLIEDSFFDAINYFQTRLLDMEALKNIPLNFAQLQLEESGKLKLGQMEFDFAQLYPTYLITNRHNLEQLSREISDDDLLAQVRGMTEQFDQLLGDIVNSLIDQQIAYVNSYLNQARYGLARHYDNQGKDIQ